MNTADTEADMKKDKGAYVILVSLASPCDVVLRGKKSTLARGLYAYCGSAMGPGGLKARIERHRRVDKKIHWHVDQVTTRASVLKAGVSFELSECDLIDRLLEMPGVRVPVPGFGSSDCRACTSHFVSLEKEEAFQDLELQSFGA